MELSPSIITFMRRNNSHIRDLDVRSSPDILPWIHPCTFPELECYSGSFGLMFDFLPGSPVKCITTHIRDLDVELNLIVLRTTTVPLEKIRITSENWDLHIFDCLGHYAPRILDIRFQCYDECAPAIEVR
jgi:hypothetical protein